MLGNRARIFAESCIEGGLSATGLLAGKIHTDAKAVENIHDGFTSFGEDGINEAGDKELDCGHAVILSQIKNAPNSKSSQAHHFNIAL
jgi:hypothetical protein